MANKEVASEGIYKNISELVKNNWQNALIGALSFMLLEGTNTLNIWNDDPIREFMGGEDGTAFFDKPIIDFWGFDNEFNVIPEINPWWGIEYVPQIVDIKGGPDGFDDITGKPIDVNYDGKVDNQWVVISGDGGTTRLGGEKIYIDANDDGLSDTPENPHTIEEGEKYWNGYKVVTKTSE